MDSNRVARAIFATCLTLAANQAFAVAVPSVSEGFKKITRAPKAIPEVSKEEAAIIDENGNVVESSDHPILRPIITVSPAPGTRLPAAEESEGHGHAPASVSVPVPAPVNAAATPVPEEPVTTLAPKAVVKSEPAPYGVPAETSLKWLTNGNLRYVKKNFRKDGRDPADRARLLAGEKAHAIVLASTDSRVAPELVFDQALGEIITVRSAGPSIDSSVLAAIELAVREQGPHLLVVMGSTNCGILELAVRAEEGKTAGSDSLDRVIADIQPRLKSIEAEKISKDLAIEATLNADGAARDLAKRSPIIAAKIESGELVVKSALYRLDTGKVTFY